MENIPVPCYAAAPPSRGRHFPERSDDDRQPCSPKNSKTNPITSACFNVLALALRRRFEPQASSYWVRREPPGPAPETMIQQF
jgi:hypothetical protein